MTARTAQSFLMQQDGVSYVVTFAQSIAACASLWSRLEREFVCTPYQKLAFCRNWLDAQAEAKPAPCCVLISNIVGEPLLFMPLSVEQHQGLRLARFMGGRLLNFSVPLFVKNLQLAEGVLHSIFAQFAEDARIDAFCIDNIPQSWNSEANPLLTLPHRRARENVHWHALSADPTATLVSMRSPRHLKNLRHKLHKLQLAGSLSIGEARLPAERAEALSMFFEQKSEWSYRHGVFDEFAVKETQNFLRALSLTEGALRIFTLRFEGSLRAILLGLCHQRHFCGLASSYEADDIAAHSPGDLLLMQTIGAVCEEGFTALDLGSFDTAHKRRWLHAEEPLYTAIFGFGWKGRALAKMLSLKHAVMSVAKRHR